MSDVIGNGDQANYGPLGQGASESPDLRDTVDEASRADELSNGTVGTDDGTDRAMSDHVMSGDPTVDPMIDEGLETDATRQTVDDVDFDSGAVSDGAGQDGTEGNV